LFYPNAFTGMAWLWDFASLSGEDGMHIAQGQLTDVSPQGRTVLFMIGWMLMLNVAVALMLQRQHALWVVAGTQIYLAVLQLMLSMDTTMSMVRTWGIGLLLLALLHLPRMERIYGFTSRAAGWPIRWMAVSLLSVAFTAGIGWMGMHSQTLKLMKPIDGHAMLQRLENYMWQQSHAYGSPAADVSRSGYGDDDSSLGGRLIPDNSLIFTATTSELSYWRGESKALYTGKGWMGTEPQWQTFEPGKAYEIADGATISQSVTWNSAAQGNQIFYSGRLSHVDTILTNQGVSLSQDLLLADTDSGKVSLPQTADPILFYQITNTPVRKVPSELMLDTAPYPAMITDTYLQLPNVTETVRQLAERVTEGLKDPYSKAAAIEQFLRTTFSYSLDQSTIPAQNEDFVSHFLFVDQKGYCDHFSTAMVVMLRSVGVPARWVKGFASGEPITPAGSGQQIVQVETPGVTVQVRGKDAHSWVEVYFPSAGWIPFEPTPGFAEQSPQLLSGSEAAPKSVIKQLIATVLSLTDVKPAAVFIQDQWKTLVISAGSLVMLLTLLLLFRKSGGAPVSAAAASTSHAMNDKLRLMDRLWRKVFRLFGVKPVQQTLREYISLLKVADGAQRQALLEFLRLYESLRYDREGRHFLSRKQIWELWKTIKNTGAG
jgi:transglutaminase-like putative cysteine protease